MNKNLNVPENEVSIETILKAKKLLEESESNPEWCIISPELYEELLTWQNEKQ